MAISIHAPLAGRDCRLRGHGADAGNFNPRAPCGARPALLGDKDFPAKFQSTRPLRGATVALIHAHGEVGISIHAPLAGRDGSVRPVWIADHDFNPRAPCGARRDQTICHNTSEVISIHAPLAGRDHTRQSLAGLGINFNPRAPCGARHCVVIVRDRLHKDFNPRAPCGARLSGARLLQRLASFQSTRPLRGATQRATA